MLVAAGLSAFLNHDIVRFVFAPIVATALLRPQLNPVPFLIASNIGAAATVVGDPQDMMIARSPAWISGLRCFGALRRSCSFSLAPTRSSGQCRATT
jgi:Citrate transporter